MNRNETKQRQKQRQRETEPIITHTFSNETFNKNWIRRRRRVSTVESAQNYVRAPSHSVALFHVLFSFVHTSEMNEFWLHLSSPLLSSSPLQSKRFVPLLPFAVLFDDRSFGNFTVDAFVAFVPLALRKHALRRMNIRRFTLPWNSLLLVLHAPSSECSVKLCGICACVFFSFCFVFYFLFATFIFVHFAKYLFQLDALTFVRVRGI